jgi:type II secretory pathway pseudopilin PulG
VRIFATTISDAHTGERDPAARELDRALAPGTAAPRVSRRSAFTMVEIALCLAIIGFALVAIIGVLPMGMNVQTNNRQETIIDEDAVVWMDALRNGARQYNELTNFVLCITNFWTTYTLNGTNPVADRFGTNWYTTTNSSVSTSFSLTNGFRIIGLLSTPKIISLPSTNGFGAFQSNYLLAYVRAMSGPAVEKFPQTNVDILANAFTYRMIVENTQYLPQDPTSIDYLSATNGLTAQELQDRRNNAVRIATLWTNAHDLRITFRWPIYPTGEAGNQRQTFRIFTGGSMVTLPDPFEPAQTTQPLYFLQPSVYTHARFQP